MAGNRNLLQETDVGEIVVYNVKDKDIPIVHRIVRKFGSGEEAQLLTKGDNNAADDTELCRRFAGILSKAALMLTLWNRRQRTGLSRAEGYHRQCCGLHTLCGICDHHAFRTPLDEDGDAGNHGLARCLAAGVANMLGHLLRFMSLSGLWAHSQYFDLLQELEVQITEWEIITWRVSRAQRASRAGVGGSGGVVGSKESSLNKQSICSPQIDIPSFCKLHIPGVERG